MNSAQQDILAKNMMLKLPFWGEKKKKRIGLTHLDDDTQAVLRSFVHTGVLDHSGL